VPDNINIPETNPCTKSSMVEKFLAALAQAYT